MIKLPDNWSDWEVLGRVGEGSYSVVYEAARKDEPGIRCAIKLITVPQDESEYRDMVSEGFDEALSRSFFEEAVRDFTREVRLMEHFKGMQNIVSIEDYKVIPKEDGIGSYIFIRMELLNSLEKYLSDKVLTEEEILQVGIDICTALEFCQEKNIIHRDIKPANIFVNDRIGTHVFYKLGDFGIARNLEGKTQGMSAKGTPNYMAPEVAASLPYDSRADIYSLGLTLYWLLNGKRLPFFPQTQLYSPAAKREALARRLAGEALPPPVNAGPRAADAILKACAYRKEDRYASASEMKRALQAAQKPEELETKEEDRVGEGTEEVPVLPETEKPKRKRAALIGAAAAALLLLAGGGKILSDRLRENPVPPVQEDVPGTGETATAVPEETETKAEADGSGNTEPEETETEGSQAPEDGEVSPGGAAVDALIQRLEEKKSAVLGWSEWVEPGEIVIPDQWDQLPLRLPLEEAPEITARQDGEQLIVRLPQGYERDTKVTLQTAKGNREGTVDETGTVWTFEAAGSEEYASLTVLMERMGYRVEYVYGVNAGVEENLYACSCIATALELRDGSDKYTASATLEELNTWEAETETNHITSSYMKGELVQYEDYGMNCAYDAKGHVIAGTPGRNMISPVVFYSDASSGRVNKQHALLKKIQAAQEGYRLLSETNQNQGLLIPTTWEELDIPAITLEDAPEIGRYVDAASAVNYWIDDAGGDWSFGNGDGDEKPLEVEYNGPDDTKVLFSYKVQSGKMVCVSAKLDYGEWITRDNSSFLWTGLQFEEKKEEETEKRCRYYRFFYPDDSAQVEVQYESGAENEWIRSLYAIEGNQTDYECEQLEDETLRLTAYKGTAENLVIPDQIDGLRVTVIGDRCFGENTALRSVTLPNTVSAVEDLAFWRCEALETIVLPAGLKKIGSDEVFSGCTSLKEILVDADCPTFESDDGVLINRETQTLICYPVAKSAYSYNVPRGIKSIENYAFMESGNLIRVFLPEGLLRIGNNAFYGCVRLAVASIPESVTEIGEYAFANCAITEAVIPDGVREIPGGVFMYCYELEAVTLPDGLETIGHHAFEGCPLRSVRFPETLKKIEGAAFIHGSLEGDLIFPEGLESIGSQAFESNWELRNVIIPKSVTEIGENPFRFCNVIQIEVSQENRRFSANRGILIDQAEGRLICYPMNLEENNYIVPDSVVEIGPGAFAANRHLTEVFIGDLVKTIGYSAFDRCENLQEIRLSNQISVLPWGVFSGCASLETLDLPEGLESIGDNAFWQCEALKTLTIPETVTEIADNAFTDCPNLTLRVVQGSPAERFAVGKGMSCELFSPNADGLSSDEKEDASQEIQGEDIDGTAAAVGTETPAPASDPESTDEPVPDWLRVGLPESDAPAEADGSAEVTEEPIPDWLRVDENEGKKE